MIEVVEISDGVVLADPDGRVVGRGPLRDDQPDGPAGEGQLTVWAPRFRTGVPTAVRRSGYEAFASWAAAQPALRGRRYVETKPADDVAQVEDWLRALTAAGFSEVATAHLWSRPRRSLRSRRRRAG
ncbi:MAG: hypothetical protein ACRDYV_01645 [Acidimicrobiia bacterium]